jgi:hypothetical protein
VLHGPGMRVHEHGVLPGGERRLLDRQRLLHGQRVRLSRRKVLRHGGVVLAVRRRSGLLSRVDVPLEDRGGNQRVLLAVGGGVYDGRRLLLWRGVRGGKCP